jgi:hypothetical protein
MGRQVPDVPFERIRDAILTEWDPIGIRGFKDWPEDEYDAYVPEVCELLLNRASFGQMFSYLWSLETEHMCLPGDRQRTEQFANYLLHNRDAFFT